VEDAALLEGTGGSQVIRTKCKEITTRSWELNIRRLPPSPQKMRQGNSLPKRPKGSNQKSTVEVLQLRQEVLTSIRNM